MTHWATPQLSCQDFVFLFDWLGGVFVVVLFCHGGGFISFLNFNFGKKLQEQRGEARGWENV